MNGSGDEPERRMVPRWRESQVTAHLGELDAVATRTRPWTPDPRFLTERIESWRRHKSPGFAADLMGAALVLQQEEIAREAAENVLRASEDVPAITRSIAEQLVQMKPPEAEELEALPDGKERFRRIHTLREQLRIAPRSPVMWMDLAREYSILGQGPSAEHAVRIAVELAPTNRFVLRSAARYYLHKGDPERAHHLVNRAPNIHQDPWLMAAEIATATVLDRTPRLVKRGRSALEGQTFAPEHITELAGAIGTLELRSGKRRHARRLFQQSLIRPNDNAVAQVSWAARHTQGIEFDPNLLQTPWSFEARAWESYGEGEWLVAARAAEEWLHDEAFSSRPAEFGSFVTSVALKDYTASISFARRGLVANPTDPLLLNNLAFALANAGKLPEAFEAFSRIDRSDLDVTMQITHLATAGLLQYRLGVAETGQMFYRRAVELAEKHRCKRERAMALLFLANEELAAASSDSAKVVAEARSAAEDAGSADSGLIKHLLDDLISRFESQRENP